MYKTYFPALDALLDGMKGNGAYAAKEGLNAHYLHTTEAQRARNTIEAFAASLSLSCDDDNAMNDAINLLEEDSERQGFINGFRLAALLYSECFAAVPAEAGYIGGYDYPHEKGPEAGRYDWVFKAALDAAGEHQPPHD